MKTAQQALSALMRLCSRAEKSSGDALRLMRTWQVPAAEQQGVLTALIREKFIDDERYAAAYVREKSRLSGWGEFKIRRQLGTKGVSREVVAAALRDNMPAGGGRLGELLERKMRGLRDEDPYKLRGKLFRYGLSLGYPIDEVTAAVERLVVSD